MKRIDPNQEIARCLITGKSIPRQLFAAICAEYTIDPSIALENEAVENALVTGDVVALRKALKNEF